MALHRTFSILALGVLACLQLLTGTLPLLAQVPRREIVVITSFPSAFYEPFRRAFEQREPGYRLRILNRKTSAAIQLVTFGQYSYADVFWASSPDAFEVLKADRRLLPLDIKVRTAETTIGAFPLDDPDGLFRGFAVSGYGMMWNVAMLARAGVPAPKSIAHLADPRFRGMIAMSAPSRSGTTHLMVETVLQRYGWRDGWAMWLRVAGNLATITARSFSVTSGVAQGRYAVGLSIDFLGRRAGEGEPLGFAYPSEAVFLPASIAILSSGREPTGALRFARFVLSTEGQTLLLDPKIQRHPLARLSKLDASLDLFERAEREDYKGRFDARLSGQRYELVNLLFDEMITERLVRLQRFWRRAAELRVMATGAPEQIREIEIAEADATLLPDEVARFGEVLPAEQVLRVPRGVPPPEQQVALVERMRHEIEIRFSAAERRLDALAHRLEAAPRVPGSVWP